MNRDDRVPSNSGLPRLARWPGSTSLAHPTVPVMTRPTAPDQHGSSSTDNVRLFDQRRHIALSKFRSVDKPKNLKVIFATDNCDEIEFF
jgi:hypothetical protein